MVGGLGGPEAEAVVVLAGEDEAAHAGRFQGAGDGVGVERGGLKNVRVFVAVAPFLVGEGVDGEVEKRGELQLVPGHLAGRREGRRRARAAALCAPRMRRHRRRSRGQKSAPADHAGSRLLLASLPLALALAFGLGVFTTGGASSTTATSTLSAGSPSSAGITPRVAFDFHLGHFHFHVGVPAAAASGSTFLSTSWNSAALRASTFGGGACSCR